MISFDRSPTRRRVRFDLLLGAAILAVACSDGAPTEPALEPSFDSGPGGGGEEPPPPSDVGASFQGLGTWPGGLNSFATGVSADGKLVVGWGQGADNVERAFRWTAATGLEDLGTLGGTGARASAASADGSWIVGRSWTADEIQKGFRWSRETGMLELPMAGATAVSDDGSLIVYLGLRWKNGVTSQTCPDRIAFGEGVSGDGQTVVGWWSNGHPDPRQDTQAFRWREATGCRDLGNLKEGAEAIGEDANRDGSIGVGQARDKDGFWKAVRWTPSGGTEDLRTLGGSQSAAFAVSADGSVIVGQSLITSALGSERAFRWTTRKQMQDLKRELLDHGVKSVENWILLSAADVSADGTVIVGYGRNPNKNFEAWVAVLPLPR
jgi:probable HAF family extracellular repeat protein